MLTPVSHPILIEIILGARRIAVHGACPPDSKAVPLLAEEYVTKVLKNTLDVPLRDLVKLAERDRPHGSAMSRLEVALNSLLPADKSASILKLMKEVLAQRLDSSVECPLHILSSLPPSTSALSSSSLSSSVPPLSSALSSSSLSSSVPPSTSALSSFSPSLDAQRFTSYSNTNSIAATPPTPPPTTLKRPRGGEIDLLERKQVAKLDNSAAKFEMLVHIASIVPANKEELTSAARAFWNQILKPFLLCLNVHHGGDKAAFLQKLGTNFNTSRFKTHGCGCVPSTPITIPQVESAIVVFSPS